MSYNDNMFWDNLNFCSANGGMKRTRNSEILDDEGGMKRSRNPEILDDEGGMKRTRNPEIPR